MINKDFVYEKVIPLIKEKGKQIDVLLIQNLFEDKQEEIVEELKKYQNDDFGFGHGLEPDIRMPNSSVAATNHGIDVLEHVKDPAIKEELVKELVAYLEAAYDESLNRFIMVTEHVEDYPHAIWWSYKDILSNFPFGNPDPEVIGFLYQNRKHLKKLNINKLINSVIDYVNSERFMSAGMHHILSMSRFYKRVDKDVRNLIKDRLVTVIDRELEKDLDKWNEYVLEPYKIYIISPELCVNQGVNLKANLMGIFNKIGSLSIEIPWQWYRDEDVFEKVKDDWLGYLYFNMIRALRLHREL
jgi:hypothetical protein